MKKWIALFTFALSSSTYAQNFWSIKDNLSVNTPSKSHAKILQTGGSNSQETEFIEIDTTFKVDLPSLTTSLFSLKEGESTYKDIELPLPNGEFATYRFTLSSVAAEELLEKYPNMLAFKGIDINNPNNVGRFDIASQGFRGMFHHNNKRIFIDPVSKQSNSEYISYYASDVPHSTQKLIDEIIHSENKNKSNKKIYARGSSSNSLRTFRLAMTASYKYTDFHSSLAGNFFADPKTVALEEIHTLVNRLNDVFQNDLSIRLELIGRQDELIITQQSNDPFQSHSFLDLELNQSFIDNTVGNNAYDIGHLLSTQAEAGIGGRAILGSACVGETKAQGFSGIDRPTSDGFYFTTVAHELGHQFNAGHTFNSTVSECIDQRNSSSAYEPGSGSTIMSYAGSCSVDNLQSDSDNYFHSYSIEEITNYITFGDGQCGTAVTTNNTQAFIDAGDDFVIPAYTPFILQSSASDSDNDLLLYTWEQLNLDSQEAGNTDGPIFRSFPPSTSTIRYLPQLSDVSNNRLTIGESYPTTAGIMTFRVTARQTTIDPNNPAFGTSNDDVNVTVDDQSGPFAIISPSANTSWEVGETHLVEWDIANTDKTPVMCNEVDILMSLDNGESFSDLFLERNTPNDGEAQVLIPSNHYSKNSRLIIQCSDQRFFTMSEAVINLNDSLSPDIEDPFLLSSSSNSKSGNMSILFFLGLASILLIKLLNKSKRVRKRK